MLQLILTSNQFYIMHWFTDVLRDKYAAFTGRATRQEYWMFWLASLLISVALNIVESALNLPAIISTLFSLAILCPSLAVAVRRLHDTDRSGWWLLLALIPFLGWAVLLYFAVLDGTPGDNRFGSNPKGAASTAPSAAPVAEAAPFVASAAVAQDDNVVINDVPASEPIESSAIPDTATSTDSGSSSSSDSSSS